METRGTTKFENKKQNGWKPVCFVRRNCSRPTETKCQNKNTTKSTQTWLNMWQKWASETKVNPKLDQYEYEHLDKMLQMFYAELRTKDGLEYEPESLKSMLTALDRHLKEQFNWASWTTRGKHFRQNIFDKTLPRFVFSPPCLVFVGMFFECYVLRATVIYTKGAVFNFHWMVFLTSPQSKTLS